MSEAAAFETLCAHAGDVEAGAMARPVAPPLHPAAVCETSALDITDRALAGEPGLYGCYSCDANPSVVALEGVVRFLERGLAAW